MIDLLRQQNFFSSYFNTLFIYLRSLYNASPNDIVEETSIDLISTDINNGQVTKPLAIILEPAKDLAEQVISFSLS